MKKKLTREMLRKEAFFWRNVRNTLTRDQIKTCRK